MRELLIDLDGLVYKAGFAVQKDIRHVKKDGKLLASYEYYKDMVDDLVVGGFWNKPKRQPIGVTVEKETVVKTEKEAIGAAQEILFGIFDKFEGYTPTLILSGDTNYRLDLFQEYKANRAEAPRPKHYEAIRHYYASQGARITDGIEADDECAILAWDHIRSNSMGVDYIIVSSDKDLLQIPGTHYNHKSDKIINIDPYTADFNFYTQLLTGDSTDNIPGLKGIGPVTAAKLLRDCDDEREMMQVCREQWQDDDAMMLSAKLLYLLRSRNDEFKSPIPLGVETEK